MKDRINNCNRAAAEHVLAPRCHPSRVCAHSTKMTVHRLLTGKRLSPIHFGRLTAVGSSCSTCLFAGGMSVPFYLAPTSTLRPFSMFCVSQLALSEQKLQRNAPPPQRPANAGSSVFASSILSTYRPQSTTPDVAPAPYRESLQKKRKRYRQKFAELIQSLCLNVCVFLNVFFDA